MNKLANLLVPMALQVPEWYARTSITGFVVLVVLWTPVTMLILASLFIRPRRAKTTGLFIAVLLGLAVGFAVVTYLLSFAFHLLLVH